MEILKYPSPQLKKQAKAVKKITDEIRKIFDEMEKVMLSSSGIGIAATQVDIPKRLIIASDGENIYKLINPVIVAHKGEVICDEGCLSFPGMIATIKRYKWIKCKAQNENGKKITIEADDLLARVIQHEIDHLNGILIIDRAEEGTFREIPKEEVDETQPQA